ncbi:LEAF RUST 10 DISEASE-RESISTANCE LOCUS RECEPTOR-LIKE PROTEIN KINASE-like 1.2 isoform X2 [Oryza glaberrima]|uniref:LEAF RUST 10 DISEASE-RESISTANCE LOCUS RECEPTOR-LIKE PROTEIN KINASE-like 1.2 isoform X2 n=1 Tax=Oryza glaberrima TaxID=4538 RepID=UPI00224C109F|nr:LEAF RUST 10 DISEASE-RESISTANCE LOCUS RECEPTOR-LIKE PROTEIN KINASE-like 1.2 isoform X2 [Oryza glaberrima]
MPLLLCRRRLLLLLLLLVAASHGDASGDTYDTSICLEKPTTCGNVSISYPFYLAKETQDINGSSNSYCGYPGLAIDCDDAQPILQLNGAEKYKVNYINYGNGSITNVSLVDQEVVNDSSGCPRVDHNMTIPPISWLFLPGMSVDYLVFFLSCSFPNLFLPPENTDPITCSFIGLTGQSYVLPKDQVPPGSWTQFCQKIYEVPVVKYEPMDPKGDAWRKGGYGQVLLQGFALSVNDSRRPPNCTQCEESEGRCGFSQAREFIGCLCPNGRVRSLRCGASDLTTGSNSKIKIIAGVVGGGLFAMFALGLIAIVFFVRKRKHKKVNSSSKLLKYSGSGGTPRSMGGDMESGSVKDLQTHLFSYEELEEATDSFNENRELGDGGFGTVYKGILRDGRVVAVKRLYNNSYRRVEQFVNEAAILSRLRHPNLVMFYGCTSSQSRELLLVYEFVANGTVADHLHGHRAQERALSWPLRLNIAVESAAALTYLHAIEPPIVHRDVKTTNILLDADFHVKVADFGLSRLFPLDVTHVSTAPQGTPGYVDPEYHQCYQLTDKSDVYSFGVVLVELISSKPAVDITRQRNEINLAGMAINRIQKSQLEELVDLELGYESDPATKKMMTMVAELAFRCLQQNGEMRPPIKEVLEGLKGVQDLCVMEKDGGKDKKGPDPPLSPDTVHAQWDSRQTTPNTSQ